MLSWQLQDWSRCGWCYDMKLYVGSKKQCTYCLASWTKTLACCSLHRWVCVSISQYCLLQCSSVPCAGCLLSSIRLEIT